jgi:hypothetical protein
LLQDQDQNKEISKTKLGQNHDKFDFECQTCYDSLIYISLFMKFKITHLLLAIYAVVFVWSAINPYDRAVRWAESLPIIFVVL